MTMLPLYGSLTSSLVASVDGDLHMKTFNSLIKSACALRWKDINAYLIRCTRECQESSPSLCDAFIRSTHSLTR